MSSIDKNENSEQVGNAAAMREAQKRYFAEKTQAALIASKQAERNLDAHMEMLRSASSRKPQIPAGIEVPNA